VHQRDNGVINNYWSIRFESTETKYITGS